MPGRLFDRRGLRTSRPFDDIGGGHFNFSGCSCGPAIHGSLLYDERNVMSSNESPIIYGRDLRVQIGDRETRHGVKFEVHPRETIVILRGSGTVKPTVPQT